MLNLYSTVLKLKALDDAAISSTQGYHAYALFLSLLERTAPTLTRELHDMQELKPFTLSPLQGKFARSGGLIKVSAGLSYWLRLTFLREDVFAGFLDSVAQAGSDHPVKLEAGRFEIEEVATTPHQSPMCHQQSFAGIIEQARRERKIGLEFFSPTAFRSKGKRNVIFPDTRLVFGSYLNRWNIFSPLKMEAGITSILDDIIVSRYALKTRILQFGSYQEVGFEGRCTYEIPAGVSEEATTHLNALADFAFFCGTGAKTTMGMGQARRVKYARTLSGRAGSLSEKEARHTTGDQG